MITIVFPPNSSTLLEVFPLLRSLSSEIYACSSNEDNSISKHFDKFFLVPKINSPVFLKNFSEILAQNYITHILCFNPTIHNFLARNSSELPKGVKLENLSDIDVINFKLDYYDSLTQEILIKLSEFIDPKEKLTEVLSSMIETGKIYGETSLSKLIEFSKIFSFLPDGDIVEIGVFHGKSAYFLSELSSIFSKGKVLLIDPWDQKTALQTNASSFLELGTKLWNWDRVFNSFIMNISMVKRNKNFNYLRCTSLEASKIYRSTSLVSSPEFNETNFMNKIAFLHIDGNHNYYEVKNDIYNWAPLVVNNGWIVFDDYYWNHGDGVKLAVDEFLHSNSHQIKEHYLLSNNLFVKVTNGD